MSTNKYWEFFTRRKKPEIIFRKAISINGKQFLITREFGHYHIYDDQTQLESIGRTVQEAKFYLLERARELKRELSNQNIAEKEVALKEFELYLDEFLSDNSIDDFLYACLNCKNMYTDKSALKEKCKKNDAIRKKDCPLYEPTMESKMENFLLKGFNGLIRILRRDN